MIGPRFVVWRLFNPKWHIMNLFDDGNFGETKSFVKDKGGGYPRGGRIGMPANKKEISRARNVLRFYRSSHFRQHYRGCFIYEADNGLPL